jgi:hypothetical protein
MSFKGPGIMLSKKTNNLSLFDESSPDDSSKKKAPSSSPKSSPANPRTLDSNKKDEFHLFLSKPKADPKSKAGFLKDETNPDVIHEVIQSTWASFNGMSDGQRNQLLKGLISRCSSKQVEYICTQLNLKMIDEDSKNHVKRLNYLATFF